MIRWNSCEPKGKHVEDTSVLKELIKLDIFRCYRHKLVNTHINFESKS
jgi:hypothetical protein